MTAFQITSSLLVITALASYVNYRFLRLPTSIGLMVTALLVSFGMVVLDRSGVIDLEHAGKIVESVDFGEILLHGMLAFLLFAGALHVDLEALRSERLSIALLATLGVLISTAVTGALFWGATGLLGFELPFIYALLFGALISPTDPIAVLSIMKRVGAPKSMEITITGESLFNDGIGVVVFLTILEVAISGAPPQAGSVAAFLLKEAVGGAVVGLAMGWAAFRLLRSVDDYPVEVLLTLALAAGGYTLAEAIHVSAPIAIVVAGLVIGNHGRALAMSDKTREHVDAFWELIDETLNAVLFVLIGLEVLALHLERVDAATLVLATAAVAAALAARLLGVAVPIGLMHFRQTFQRGTILILTWGGLRGGISIALALSLPPLPEREIILNATYAVVVFSVLVQGLTLGPLIAHGIRPADA